MIKSSCMDPSDKHIRKCGKRKFVQIAESPNQFVRSRKGGPLG
jgi:hypothetical protein